LVAAVQLCDGASPEERQRWFLRPAQEFHYLNQSTCFDIPGDSNAEEYKVSPKQAQAVAATYHIAAWLLRPLSVTQGAQLANVGWLS
jgi:hypothetical protein